VRAAAAAARRGQTRHETPYLIGVEHLARSASAI
jgi:hypothetical protein